METLRLIQASEEYAEQIKEYRNEFEDLNVTHIRGRIPGLSYLEEYDDVRDWLQYTNAFTGKVTWYMTIREADDRIIGFVCIRNKLEYDDDDTAFASHIGYSIRPSEQGKGYAKEQLKLALKKAEEAGIETVRLVCRDTNTASRKTIEACGGRYIDSIYGEESGATVLRYDIDLRKDK